MRPFIVIEKYNVASADVESKPDVAEKIADKFNLPYEKAANALMSAEGYSEYIEKHGYHFTEALAEYASKLMKNADGSTHTWTTAMVKKSMEGLGLTLSGKTTLGDMTYAANMAYADFYPDPLKDDASCIKYAAKATGDIDGYDGIIFCRWTADLIGKGTKINWKKFI